MIFLPVDIKPEVILEATFVDSKQKVAKVRELYVKKLDNSTNIATILNKMTRKYFPNQTLESEIAMQQNGKHQI